MRLSVPRAAGPAARPPPPPALQLLLLAALVAQADAGWFSWWPFFRPATPVAPVTMPITEPITVPMPATTSPPPAPAPTTAPTTHTQAPQVECHKDHDAHAEKLLMDSMRLHFYYGSGPGDKVVVELGDAAKLINALRWKHDHCVALFVHGLRSSPDQPCAAKVIQAYVRQRTWNVLALNWSGVAGAAAGDADGAWLGAAGAAAARAMDALAEAGAEVCQAVGAGAGAHLAGHIGRRVRKPFKHVVGVDPSGPMPCEQPLNASDATCVSTVHTAWNDSSPAPLLGHLAFFPRGVRQPHAQPRRAGGESAEACEEPALALWAEAVRHPKDLVGRHCASWESFATGQCQGEPVLQMRLCEGPAGSYYLRTRATEPFGLGMEGASPPPPASPTTPTTPITPTNGASAGATPTPRARRHAGAAPSKHH